MYETSQYRFYREPSRDYPVTNLNEYAQIFAERVPEEEGQADDNNFIPVFHFQNEPNRAHGVPFKFLLIEVCLSLFLPGRKRPTKCFFQGEKFSETKKRLEKRTGLKGKSFEKIKFALVRRANYSKPQYLTDGKLTGSISV